MWLKTPWAYAVYTYTCMKFEVGNQNISKAMGKHGIHTDVSDDKLLTTTIATGMPQNI